MSAALDVLNGLVLEDGRRWGDAAFDFQREDAEAIFDVTGPPYHFQTRGRGGSKTGDLAGIALALALTEAPPGAKMYGGAADKDQARLLIDSIAGYRNRTPELKGLRVEQYRVAVPRTGVVLEMLAADAPGSWGLRPWFLIVDELAQWGTTPGPRSFWEAITSAVAKIPGSRLAVITSAGDPAHWSRKVLDHALEDPLWRVNETPGPVPWLDPDRLEEQRRRLPESLYRRLFLNEWTAAEDRLVTPDDLAAATILDGPLAPESGRQYMIGLDLGITGDATVAAVCHGIPERLLGEGKEVRTGTRIILDRIATWQGTSSNPVDLSEVEEWIDLTARAYNRAAVHFDPYQAIHLTQRLKSRGLRVQGFTFSSASVARLAHTLFELLRSRTISLPDDPDLLDELANVRLVERSPGVYRIDHDPDKHDDRAIALALAAHGILYPQGAGEAKVLSGIRYSEDRTYRSGDFVVHNAPDIFFDEER